MERNCSVGRTIRILSDAWSFLIVRECLFGARRFEQFQSRLGLPRQTLIERLRRLNDQGLLRKVEYMRRPPRYEYRLTNMGMDLYPSLITMLRFGDKWIPGKPQVPLQLIHKSCGCECEPLVACSACGEEVKAREVKWRDGPGAGGEAIADARRSRRSSDGGQFHRGRPSSVSRTLEIIGDRWTFMVSREAFLGARRFDQFLGKLNIAPNILTDRLNRLVTSGVFVRRRYQTSPDRHEYRLTEMGLDLYGPFIAIMRWGDTWLSGGRPPLILTHKLCGQDFSPEVICDKCRKPLNAWDMKYRLNYELTEDGEVVM